MRMLGLKVKAGNGTFSDAGTDTSDSPDLPILEREVPSSYNESDKSIHKSKKYGITDWALKYYYVPTAVTSLLMIFSPVPLYWTVGNSSRLFSLVVVNGILYYNLQDSDPGYIEPPPEHDFREDRRPMKPEAFLPDARSNHVQDANLSDAEKAEILAWKRWPPMRAAYCKMKERYVAKFDHSCDILQTPIGEKNHCLFWWWLFGSFLQFLQACAIAKTRFQWSRAYADMNIIPIFVVVVFMDVLIFLSGILLMTQTILLLTASTTYEYIEHEKIPYLRGMAYEDFPFSRGIISNLRLACWTHGFLLLFKPWKPHVWTRPKHVNRDSEDICSNPLENK